MRFLCSTLPGRWAVTARDREDNWRREILPICGRCNRLIDEGGLEGRVLKATGELWYAGHTIGHIGSPGGSLPTSHGPYRSTESISSKAKDEAKEADDKPHLGLGPPVMAACRSIGHQSRSNHRATDLQGIGGPRRQALLGEHRERLCKT